VVKLDRFYCIYIYIYMCVCVCVCVCVGGPSSSVGIASDYGLDGPGSNTGGDEIFRPSRPALGSTQPPLQWVLVLSGGKVRPGRAADHSSPSSAAVMEEYSYTPSQTLGHTESITGLLYFSYIYIYIYIYIGQICMYKMPMELTQR